MGWFCFGRQSRIITNNDNKAGSSTNNNSVGSVAIQSSSISKLAVVSSWIESHREIVEDGEVAVECGSEFELYSSLVPLVWSNRIGQTSILLWKFPVEFSQSRLCGRKERSQACTLIALKVAEHFYRKRLIFPQVSSTSCYLTMLNRERQFDESKFCPPPIVNALLNGILDGNDAHTFGMQKLKPQSPLFNVPLALLATNEQFREIEYCAMTGSIQRNLATFLRAALESPLLIHFKQLFFLLLAFERTVLLIAQRHNNTISVIDPHVHLNDGAYIASGQMDQLELFTAFLGNTMFIESTLLPNELQSFELSLLQFCGHTCSSDCPMDDKFAPIRVKHQSGIFPEVPIDQWSNPLLTKKALEALRKGDMEWLQKLLRAIRMRAGYNNKKSKKTTKKN